MKHITTLQTTEILKWKRGEWVHGVRPSASHYFLHLLHLNNSQLSVITFKNQPLKTDKA